MSKPKALVTTLLFPSAHRLLEEHFDVEYWPGPNSIPRLELLKKIASVDALICSTTDKIDNELLNAAPKLRVVSTLSVGYDHIDIDACTSHKVTVTSTPGVLDDATADLAWSLLMTVSRRIVEGDAWTRSGTWKGLVFENFLGTDVSGKTLGIIGLGRIGREMARRANGFKMRVLYCNRNRAPLEIEKDVRAEFTSFDALLAESDFISLHVPLFAATRHLISSAAFEKMKPTAFIINSTRGPVIDENALVQALDAGKIAGAGLDVYEQEPKVHPGLLARKNVVLTPHIGSATVETRGKMARLAVDNTIAVFAGRKPASSLNSPKV